MNTFLTSYDHKEIKTGYFKMMHSLITAIYNDRDDMFHYSISKSEIGTINHRGKLEDRKISYNEARKLNDISEAG